MSRLAAAIQLDVRLQVRNGFYHAAAFVAVFSVIGLRYLSADMRAFLLPPLLVSNLVVGTFYFVAGLVLLEKNERTLDAIAVSPLRVHEVLASKVLTLGALSLVENGVIVVLGHGLRVNLLLLGLGIVLAAVIYTLLGWIVVDHYSTINEFLLPSIAWMTPLFLPYLYYFGLSRGVWLEIFFRLQPLQPAMTLLAAAFRPVPPIELLYALVAGGFWVGALWRWASAPRGEILASREGVTP